MKRTYGVKRKKNKKYKRVALTTHNIHEWRTSKRLKNQSSKYAKKKPGTDGAIRKR